MVEAILHKEIDKLKKDLAEKDDKIHALELISAESIAHSSASHSDSVNGHSQHDLEAGLTKLRHALQCSICVELFSEPHTVDCGHTFCYQCLKQWLEIRKQCPTCRKTLTRRPMLSFTVQHQVEIYLAHLSPKSESENYRKRVETAKDTSDGWENIFHKERKTTYLEDIEDDTRRCPSCNWELVGQECVNCGEIYHDAPEEDSEEGESVNTNPENGEESGNDDSESQNSFVVDDDVVEYSDASQDVHDEIENLDDEDSEDDYSARSRKRKRGRRSRASPVVVNLGSSSEESEVVEDYEEAEQESDGYNDFQSPPPQFQRRDKKHKKSKTSNRRVIALDDSDEESMSEANSVNSKSESEANDSQENGNTARQTFHISSDEDETSDDDDQETALLALAQGSSPGISSSTANTEENTSSKKNKKKKKSKKHSHSHKDRHHKKDKGKARA